jgi:signal transduction histidine kinase
LELERLDVNGSLNVAVIDGDRVVFTRAKGEYSRLNLRRSRQLPPEPPFGTDGANGATVLYNDGKCVVQKGYDRFFRSYHLVLSATLDNGYALFIRSPMDSITESVNISNRFIIMAGSIALVIGAFGVFFISRRFTRPILKLSAIANEMAHLNFNVKYDVRGQDELNRLGDSVNILSRRLERTISELKTANAQLQKDIEIKNRIDEMRREFLSNVSHELKTPIALIQGYAEGLRDNIAGDGAGRAYYCDVILDESAKMDKMIQKLLTLMQIESGRDPVTIRRFEITGLIRALIAKNQRIFEREQIRVLFDVAEEVYVWGDEFLIENVLSNYLSNALNHADGDKTIAFEITGDGKTTRISVFNTGQRIPEEELDKIWRSFYKTDKARSREYGGSGIGLAVVSAVMKALGKPYGAENVDGGVVFYIELDS